MGKNEWEPLRVERFPAGKPTSEIEKNQRISSRRLEDLSPFGKGSRLSRASLFPAPGERNSIFKSEILPGREPEHELETTIPRPNRSASLGQLVARRLLTLGLSATPDAGIRPMTLDLHSPPRMRRRNRMATQESTPTALARPKASCVVRSVDLHEDRPKPARGIQVSLAGVALIMIGLAVLADQGLRYIAARAPFGPSGLEVAEAGPPWAMIVAGILLAAGVILTITGSRKI